MDYADTVRLAAMVKQKGFQALVPGCTDVSYAACAKVSCGRFPGLEQPEVVECLQRKDHFRSLATSLQLQVPPAWDPDGRRTPLEVMFKPVDSFSGKGMTLLQRPKAGEIRAAIRKARQASPAGKFVAEHFVRGRLHSHSAFIRGGRITADFFVQEDCVAHAFAVDLSRMAHQVPARIKRRLRQNISRLVRALALTDGLLHTQFILQGDRYWLIEVTRRCPGDLYSLLVEYSTGFPYAAAYVAPFLGAKTPWLKRENKQFIIRHTACPRIRQQDFWGFRFRREINLMHLIPLAKPGECLPPGPSGRAALMFLATHSQRAQDQLYEELLHGKLYDFS
jgi:biotin carboxylase